MVTGDTAMFLDLFTGPPPKYTNVDDYQAWLQKTFGASADLMLAAYPARTASEAAQRYYEIQQDKTNAEQYLLATARAAKGKSATYLYYFTHVMPGPKSEVFGAFHTADLPYSLGYLSPERQSFWQAKDRVLADQMSSYWANFARTGNPNGSGLPTWTPYAANQISLQELGDSIKPLVFDAAKNKAWLSWFKASFSL